MDLTKNQHSVSITIEKRKILGAVLELPTNSTAILANFALFLGKWAGLAVMSSLGLECCVG